MSEYDIPDGYERIGHHDHLDLFNESRGIVITVHERDRLTQEVTGKYPYRVIGAQNQEGFYDGSFQSLSHAEEKVLELAKEH